VASWHENDVFSRKIVKIGILRLLLQQTFAVKAGNTGRKKNEKIRGRRENNISLSSQ
jgi:hypothetical protein